MIPYAFAKAHGVVVSAVGAESAQVAVRAGAHAGALAELRRALGLRLVTRRVGAEEFDELIAAAYNSAANGAAAGAGAGGRGGSLGASMSGSGQLCGGCDLFCSPRM